MKLVSAAQGILAKTRDVQLSLPLLLNEINSDDDLLAELLSFMREEAARRLLDRELGSLLRNERQAREAPGRSLSRSADMSEWGQAVARGFLDTFEIRPGLMLGDAKRDDVSKAADAWSSRAQDALVKHNWLRLIAQSLPDGVRARDHFTESRLLELKREAISERA